MLNRNKVAQVLAEFLGAATLTMVVLAVANSRIGFPLFIAGATGLAYALIRLTLGAASGGQANPAVSLGLWTLRKLPTAETIVNVASQLLGGFAALGLFEYLTNQALPNIAGAAFDWRVLAAEAAGAFVLGFGLAAVTYQRRDDWVSAVMAGSALATGMLVASVAANGLVNPAIALGARSVSRAYVVGPLLGSVIGMNVYSLVFAPRKQTARAAVAPTTVRRRTASRRATTKRRTTRR